MREPSFDIFSARPDNDACWLEAIDGLSNARERTEQIAAEKSGQYFIFSNESHSVVAQMETFTKPEAKDESDGGAGGNGKGTH
jgi:hypothetical protein